MNRNLAIVVIIVAAVAGIWLWNQGGQGPGQLEQLAGTVTVDGSSTVFPITEAIAEEFGKVHPRVRITVGVSGTGGGFKKFCVGETDINDASRTIKSSEQEQAASNGISYIELPVAFDGISVVVNPKNTFVDYLTTEELKKIWEPGSRIQTWQEVRADWPDQPLKLYGPGTDSGTFDYFTEAINGKSQACRSDFTASEDDNVLVQGIAGDVHALGFFGFAYYVENKDKLKIVPIDGGQGPVAPTHVTINNSSYMPLSRPIFIYVSAQAAKKPPVHSFVSFYLKHAGDIAQEVGYVALPENVYALVKNRFETGVTGSAYADGDHQGQGLEELLKQ